jgi:hypothetical protein
MENNNKKIWLEVFDCLFGEKEEQYHYNNPMGDMGDIPDKIKDMLSKIQGMTDESFSKEEMDDIFMEEMGPPSEITEYTEGNINYTKKVWDGPEGKFVRIVASLANGVDYEDLSLEEKLEIAIQNEDYEKAGKLKEEIENNKNADNQEDTEKE